MASTWLRYSWDLKALPAKVDSAPLPLTIRAATKEEQATVSKVVDSAFSMDTGLADIHKQMISRLESQIEAAFALKDPSCLVLQHGSRIVGCSVLRLDEESDHNLVSGPCVLHEYRSRGFGSSLLGASLVALREAGLRRGLGIARDKTVAARFLYPKFGGVAEPWTTEAELRPRLAA